MDLPQVLVGDDTLPFHERAPQLMGMLMDVCHQRAEELGTIAEAVKPLITPLREVTVQMVRLTLAQAINDEARQRELFTELIDHMGDIFRDLDLAAYLDGDTIIVSEKG